MEKEQAVRLGDFVSEMIGAGKSRESYEKLENAKRTALDEAMSGFTPEIKESIREGMSFRVVDKKGKKHERTFDKRGQEYSVDTFGATKKGLGISKSDKNRAQGAMDQVVELTRKAIDKLKDLKKPDGTRVYPFDSDDDDIRLKAQLEFGDLIEREVFTPLVREGILPENFVIDDYSEVQKLLNGTFESYKATTEESRKEDQLKQAEIRSNAVGTRNKLDVLAGIGGQVEQLQNKAIARVLRKKSLDKQEKIIRNVKFTKDLLSTGGALLKAGITVKGWVPDENGERKIIRSQEKFLQPGEFKNQLGEVRNEDGELVATYSPFHDDDPLLSDGKKVAMSDDALRMELEQARRAKLVTDLFDKISEKLPFELPTEEVIWMLDNIVDSDELFYSTEGVGLLVSVINDGIVSLALPGHKITTTNEELDSISKEYEAREAASAAAQAIDTAIAEGIAEAVSDAAGICFEGVFLNEIDLHKLHEFTAPANDGDGVAETIADAIRATFRVAAPSLTEGVYEEFVQAGVEVAKQFKDTAGGKDFKKTIEKLPNQAFAPMVKAARAAVVDKLPEGIKEKLKDDLTLRKIVAKSLIPDEEKSLEEWEQSEEELRQYETALVLIDDGGVTAAEERSIERLITELEKDRAVLKLVTNIGSVLTGVGGGGVNIANRMFDKLTDVVAGEILGPLKAAKLIMQFAVSVKKASDRRILLAKFELSLERSKTAVSSLSSTIQGFVNNKEEQITFGDIEAALLAVQAAAAILGSIPEPHVLAIGKTLSACAAGAQELASFAENTYGEKKLKEAWDTTKAALDNPRDRALGLAALRLNPSLGMHAIAWAAMTKTPPDPIARMFLDSAGVSEQSLAVSGTESKVREYLQTLLHEDRQMIDSKKINSDWAPETYRLSMKDWFVITTRAQRDAKPKLKAGPEKSVLEALKKTDKHQLKKLDGAALKGEVSAEELERHREEAVALCQALKDYRAVSVDNSEHREMAAIADEFLKFAAQHRDKVLEIIKRVESNDPKKVAARLQELGKVFVELFGAQGNEPKKGLKLGAATQAVNLAKVEIGNVNSRPAVAEKPEVDKELKKLKLQVESAELWIRQQNLINPPKKESELRQRSRKEPTPQLEK